MECVITFLTLVLIAFVLTGKDAARHNSTICSITSQANGTIRGNCKIGRVFSSAGHYSCQLRQEDASLTLLSISNYTVQPISGDNNYYNGTCGYSAALSAVAGTYSYVVIVYPGATVLPVIETCYSPPSADPVIVCSIISSPLVTEHSSTDCHCTASDLGQPPGRLLVYRGNILLQEGSYGDSNVTFTVQSVNRTNSTLRCQLDWITDSAQDRKAEHTLNVAYGPDYVTLIDQGLHYLDLNLSSPSLINLTCQVLDYFPSVAFTWSGPCVGVTTNTCSLNFALTSPDNITCTAFNTFTGNSVTSSSRVVTFWSKPVLLLSSSEQVEVSDTNSEIHLSLTMIASPLPNVFAVLPLASRQHASQPVLTRPVNGNCITGNTSYLVKCDVVIKNMTSGKEEYYVINVENKVGSIVAMVQITKNGTSAASTSGNSKQLSTASAVGITVAVNVVAFGLITALFMFRRQLICQRFASEGKTRGSQGEQSSTTIRTSNADPASDVYEVQQTGDEASKETPITMRSTYSALKTSEVGCASEYAEYKPYYNTYAADEKQDRSHKTSNIYCN